MKVKPIKLSQFCELFDTVAAAASALSIHQATLGNYLRSGLCPQHVEQYAGLMLEQRSAGADDETCVVSVPGNDAEMFQALMSRLGYKCSVI